MARPREFEPETALQAITETFWEKGFEGTSLQDLVGATGLKKGSLYAAFGDKRAMYHAALRQYDRHEISAAIGLLRKPGSAREKVARLFDAVLQGAARPDGRRGCLICNAAIDQAATDDEASKVLTASIARLEAAIIGALDAETENDGYPPDFDKQKTGQGLLASYFGLRVLAKSGTGADFLRSVRDDALDRLKAAEHKPGVGH